MMIVGHVYGGMSLLTNNRLKIDKAIKEGTVKKRPLLFYLIGINNLS